MSTIVYVPVKRFQVAKERLAPSLGDAARSRLGKALASRTLETIADAGLEPVVMAADEEVGRWARGKGWRSLADPARADLSRAAEAAATAAGLRSWMVVHADLPLLTETDMIAAQDAVEAARNPIAPSKDGGTSLVGGTGPFAFAYGAGSFHRHLGRLPSPQVLARIGLSLDLDDPTDLRAAASHPRGAWLLEYADRT